MGNVANEGTQPIDLPRAESRLAVSDAPTFPMNAVWRTIRGYFWWSYERGTLHYDIMVTLILIFVFFSPYWINFNDKPVEHNPHPTGVVVVPDKQGGFIYQIDSTAVTGKTPTEIQDQLRQIIEPISGAVSITRFEATKDAKGNIQNYKVWVQKE
jgi:hypothetical protein